MLHPLALQSGAGGVVGSWIDSGRLQPRLVRVRRADPRGSRLARPLFRLWLLDEGAPRGDAALLRLSLQDPNLCRASLARLPLPRAALRRLATTRSLPSPVPQCHVDGGRTPMDLPHSVHPAVEAHHPSSESAIRSRPPAGRFGLQARELWESAPGRLEGGTAGALVPGPGADGGGAHVDELQEGGGIGAGFHAPKDTAKSRRRSFDAPLTQVLRVEVYARPTRGYIYRLDLECGHRVSRLANASREPQPDLAPRDARCIPCLALLEVGRLPTQAGGGFLEGA